MSLAEDLADWTDWDVSAYYLGRSLGLFRDQNFSKDAKHVFWTDNDLGNGLHDALLALVKARVLEHREEPDEQFRWQRLQAAAPTRWLTTTLQPPAHRIAFYYDHAIIAA